MSTSLFSLVGWLRITALAIMSCVLISGCATRYAPADPFGFGYTDRKIDEATYVVTFRGNTKSSEDSAWNLWAYRCAELTIKNGYEYFALKDSVRPKVSWGMDAQWTMQHVTAYGAPTYSFTPGYAVSTYTMGGVIRMFKSPLPEEVPVAIDAKTVLEMLKAYVATGDKRAAPSPKEIQERAAVRPARSS